MTNVLASALFQIKHISMYLQHLSHFKMKNISSQYRFLFFVLENRKKRRQVSLLLIINSYDKKKSQFYESYSSHCNKMSNS
jgi:hypothetical protein